MMAENVLQAFDFLHNYLTREVATHREEKRRENINQSALGIVDAIDKLPANASQADISRLQNQLISTAAKSDALQESMPLISGLIGQERVESKTKDFYNYAVKNLGYTGPQDLAPEMGKLLELRKAQERTHAFADEFTGDSYLVTTNLEGEEIARVQTRKGLSFQEKEKIRLRGKLSEIQAEKLAKGAYKSTGKITKQGHQVVEDKSTGMLMAQILTKDGIKLRPLLKEDEAMTTSEATTARSQQLTHEFKVIQDANQRAFKHATVAINEIARVSDTFQDFLPEETRNPITQELIAPGAEQMLNILQDPAKWREVLESYNADDLTQIDTPFGEYQVPKNVAANLKQMVTTMAVSNKMYNTSLLAQDERRRAQEMGGLTIENYTDGLSAIAEVLDMENPEGDYIRLKSALQAKIAQWIGKTGMTTGAGKVTVKKFLDLPRETQSRIISTFFAGKGMYN